MKEYILNLEEISKKDLSKVGGKNASLGELFQHLTQKGILVPDGFAVTARAYREFLKFNHFQAALRQILGTLDRKHYSNLSEVGQKARNLIRSGTLPYALQLRILAGHHHLKDRIRGDLSLAVRSSATAEDLPQASFAGQQESFLNVRGEDALLQACLNCYASLFTDRAIKYREDMGFDHLDVALSIGIQQMVRSDKACAGVAFTLDPDSGFRNVVILNGSWGLGENVVKGNVEPDEFMVYKPNLEKKLRSIISKKIGKKEKWMIYSDEKAAKTTLNVDTPPEYQKKPILSDQEIETLARWCVLIEEHYQMPMDIEWAKDGLSGDLYIVQARPETVHARAETSVLTLFQLKEKGKLLTKGNGLGNKIASGKARLLRSPKDSHLLQPGEVLVTDTTDPDWDPILKKAAAVITNRGGRTSHAAIVARELGVVAVVGTHNGTEKIRDGQEVTVSSAEGKTGFVYEGLLQWEETAIDTSTVEMPNTETMLILGDPERAFQYARLPNDGIGLMRLEFIINNSICVHPMALVKFEELEDPVDKQKIEELSAGYPSREDYFVEKLAQAVGTIAAAFYPKDVIVRMSDFKSNEYANLIGGRQFEPEEENPMLGFRGASRYYHKRYRQAFRLECEAMKRVRGVMGFDNVKLMIPFCRTVEEGRKVIRLMERYGLKRGEAGLEIYTMIEVPSNVLLAAKLAELFDGFSIGSNDLTQLTLGLDRDNTIISDLFNENDPAVKKLISRTIKVAKKHHIKTGLCGQAPSDFPEFAQFLVQQGIDSISFNADALWQGLTNIRLAEKSFLESVSED